MAEQRKATDASGKGVEDDSMGGRASNYKPKMPGRGRGAPRAGVGGGRSDSTTGQTADNGAPKKIPKWKL